MAASPRNQTVAQQDLLAVADVLDAADGEVLTLSEIASETTLTPSEADEVLGLLERQAAVDVTRQVSLEGEPAWIVEA